jgi:hypothetical protein
MVFQKWIIINDLNHISTFKSSVPQNEIQFCWFPASTDMLFSNETLLFFLTSSHKITIGLNTGFKNILKGEDVKLIEQIIRLFFQLSYKKQDGIPYLLSEQREMFENDFFYALKLYSERQGFASIKPLLISGDNYFQITNDPSSKAVVSAQMGRLTERWINYTIEMEQIEQIPVFISIKNGNENETDLFIACVKVLMEQNNGLALVALLIKQNEKNQMIGFDLQKCEKEKNDLHSFLKIQKGESKYLLEWYKYEYEILPVWYKQIGHLIKVLMGKRSLKSLFRDDVKKYKQ